MKGNINYFLHKSKYLIIFFATISTIITLSVSTLYNDYERFSSPPDFLSDNSVSINIFYNGSNKNITIRQIIEKLNSLNHDYMLYKQNENFGKSVYIQGKSSLKPDIIEGRNFNDSDFAEGKNVALVRFDHKETCNYKEEDYYINQNGNEYKVVGFFKDENLLSNPNSQYYLNLNYNTDALFEENYILDGYEKTDYLYEELKSYISTLNSKLIIRYSKIEINPISQLLIQKGMIVLLISLSVFLVLLNTFNFTISWIKSRRKEIAVRRLIGAGNTSIKLLLLKDYIVSISIGFIIGIFINILIKVFDLFSVFKGDIKIPQVIISYILCIVIGVSTGFIMINKNLNKNINEGIRNMQ